MNSSLTLSRRVGESITVGDDVEVVLVSIGPGQRVRLRILAPKTMKIQRRDRKDDQDEQGE